MVVVGLDEAGAGPGFGSLWASAVYLTESVPGLADSKKISERRRMQLRDVILESCHYGLGEVTSAEIDELGMGEARRLVFDRALDDYAARDGPPPTHLIVDGTLFRPWRGVPFTVQPRADATVPVVSAASILAKTTRDAQVSALCDAHPELHAHYDLRSNKGYLSRKHIDGIRTHGYSDWHRRSFHIRSL